MADPGTFAVSADGSHALYGQQKKWFVVGADKEPKEGEGALKLDIGDETRLPATYLVPQPAKPDRTAITTALKAGLSVEGAALVRGQPFITVSVR